jgi:hypothetical protein
LTPGADRTVFSADYFQLLRLDATTAAGLRFQGVSGTTDFVTFPATIILSTTTGATATVHGTFAAFVDATATDFNILGRDVLNNFDLIMGRNQGDIRLLAPLHGYRVTGP